VKPAPDILLGVDDDRDVERLGARREPAVALAELGAASN
jgi:hypothetical protein